MGNRKLVAACVEEYGVPVDIVTICKAARHGHSYVELWKPFLQNTHLVPDVHQYSRQFDSHRSSKYVRTAEWAALGGHLRLSSALATCSWRATGESPSPDERYVQGVNIAPDRLIYQLAKGGHVDHAAWVYAHLSDHQRTTLSEAIGKSFVGLVFEGAVKTQGNLAFVNWCMAQDSHVLEETTYWDENDNALVGWPLLDLLMWKAMTYGSMEWCMLAVEKGWQPKVDGEGARLVGLIYECLFCAQFIPTSNHFACMQYLHTKFADPVTLDHIREYSGDYSEFPTLG